MKKLILVLMAMLLMAGIASAGFEAFYKGDVSPYKMLALNGTYRVTIAPDNVEDTSISFKECDVSDVRPYVDDGYVPCTEVLSQTSSLTLINRSDRKSTKQAFVTSSEVKSLRSAVFDVFYRARVCPDGPYKMFWFNATKIVISKTSSEDAVMDFNNHCDISDTPAPPTRPADSCDTYRPTETPLLWWPIDSDGGISCLDIRSPDSSAIIVKNEGTGEEVRTSEAYIYMHDALDRVVCTDTDGMDTLTKGYINGVHEYFTGGYPESARERVYSWSDMCSGALRGGAVPTEGIPYIVNEWYCEGNRVKSQVTECAAGEMCSDGRCVPLPASDRSGSCASVECAEGEVCRVGVCVVMGAAATEDRKVRIRDKINSMKTTLAKTEATKCRTPEKAIPTVSGDMDVTKLTAALKELSATQARIAKCAGISGFETAPAVKASTKADVSKLLAAFHSNAKAMMKTKTMSDVRASAKTEATKTAVDATKTPETAVKKSVFSRLFNR